MHKNKLEQYFLDKNLDVSFNTLGSSELLIELFVKETEDIVHSCYGKTSNHVKSQCYSKYYKMDERTKFTGFEKFEKLDKQLRNKMSQHVAGLFGMPTTEVKKPEHVFGSYLQELKDSFKRFKTPLLYLSGGIDSEFVALAMLDAGVEFTPVIFQWVDDVDKVYNIHDILYAVDFCNTHGLSPLMRKVNLEKLWNNPEFELLAKETNISSPQVNTYVYMIELMGQEFSDSTHVLGGEVRFGSRFDANSGKLANFALAAKVPAGSIGYNGLTYGQTRTVNAATLNPSTMFMRLNYTWDGNYTFNQGWTITSTDTITQGSLFDQSGNWFNADLPGGTGFDYSTNGGVTWNTLPAGATTTVIEHATIVSSTQDTDYDSSSTYTLSIRSKSEPGTVVSTSITFRNIYNYTPTLDTFTSNGTWSKPSGINTGSVVVVGGGGAGGGAQRTSGSAGEQNGASGGGGAGAVALQYNGTLPVAIPITVGAGGFGQSFAAGLPGDSSSAFVDVNYVSAGGGGGNPNPNSGSNLGGSGGSNISWVGGTGAASLFVEESYGGGGAGAGGNGGNATFGGPVGAGGPSASTTLTKAGSSYTVTYGAGGDGGDGGVPGTTGSIPGGGGSGGSIVDFLPTPSVAGGDGGAGRVYIYY